MTPLQRRINPVAHSRRFSVYRVLTCKSAWYTLFLAAVCGVLAFDHSWRACLVILVVVVLGLLATNEDLRDFDTDGKSSA
jgi:hypothetical protein